MLCLKSRLPLQLLNLIELSRPQTFNGISYLAEQNDEIASPLNHYSSVKIWKSATD